MKTVEKIAEEMLERYTDTLSISDIVDDIVKIREEAYNQALEDVAKSIKLKLYSLSPYDDTSDGYRLNETSITPLYTRGFNGFINGKVEIDKDSILKLKKMKTEPTNQITLTCEVCGKEFLDEPPIMCCSGRECGCMGRPIDPVVCSNECFDKIINKYKK